MSDLTPGTTIGVYEIERSLGGGGFAAVYLAKHRFLHSKHALKVLASHLAAEVEVRDRFLAEARILAQLQHPNLVRVTDILIEPGVAALVMEFVAGPTLETELAGAPRGKPVAWAKAMMAPLLDAVQFAHAHGIVHRDLKRGGFCVGLQRELQALDGLSARHKTLVGRSRCRPGESLWGFHRRRRWRRPNAAGSRAEPALFASSMADEQQAFNVSHGPFTLGSPTSDVAPRTAAPSCRW